MKKKDRLEIEKEKIEKRILREMGLDASWCDRCFLCNGYLPVGPRDYHRCKKAFVKAGVNPCKHRGSESVAPRGEVAFRAHKCVICGIKWICECDECRESARVLRELFESNFSGQPSWPSPVQCPCGTTMPGMVQECPLQTDSGLVWFGGCDTEYPHYHVRCAVCRSSKAIVEEDIGPYRLEPRQATDLLNKRLNKRKDPGQRSVDYRQFGP